MAFRRRRRFRSFRRRRVVGRRARVQRIGYRMF